MKHRIVQPEILDSLAPDDPRVEANRKDLRRINFLMGNWRWVARQLKKHLEPGQWIVEAGAGEGDLGEYLRQTVPILRDVRYTSLDRVPAPPCLIQSGEWLQQDFLDWVPDPSAPPDVLVVNLLLHQFTDEQLASLASNLQSIPLWIFCEPLRSRVGLLGLTLLRPLGLCDVSWHDGRVSVRAGFRGNELPDHLCAASQGRGSRICYDLRGGYRMISWKTGTR